MKAEVVVDGIPFAEGPVWCDNGTLVVTSVAAGCLYRVWPGEQRAKVIADTGGGANGAVAASDGGFLVTQNGGIDFSAVGLFDDIPPVRHATPGLQRVLADGSVAYAADAGFNAPNDLCVDAGGTVWFTDPGHYPPPDPPVGRVMALSPTGEVRVVADGFWYCNGIALTPAGDLVVVERAGLQRVAPDGSAREWVCEALGRGGGDGFCLDVDGRFYVASTVEHGVRVLDPDGREVDFLEIEGKGVTTNCSFGGDDGRTLFATDAVPGRVVAWEGLPAPGLALPAWPAPSLR